MQDMIVSIGGGIRSCRMGGGSDRVDCEGMQDLIVSIVLTVILLMLLVCSNLLRKRLAGPPLGHSALHTHIAPP